ncbi:uncharacterized protein LOC124166110 [Ischnura elegans]|uniref:uncharacterized protein LOC124166110 n=1 Tax=Ischnura elegans TaxID=197161 RepID=UPI001ED8AE0E|nr:uncharacterized protein LOC124166110 [Ischnura elegans]
MAESPKVRGPVLAIKIVELALAMLCCGLIPNPFYHSLHSTMHHVALSYVTFAGYILINAVLIITYLTEENVPKRMATLFSLVGCILFIASGSVIIEDWRTVKNSIILRPSKQYMDQMIAAGIISLFNGAIYLVDVGLTFKFG